MIFKNINIVFYSINPLNFIFAFILSLFFKVIYWRKINIPKVFLYNFHQLFEYGSFDMQDWATKLAPVHCLIKEKINVNNKFKNESLDFLNGGLEANLKLAAAQNIVLDYEKIFHFFELLKLHKTKYKYTNTYIVHFNIYKKLLDINLISKSKEIKLVFNFNCYIEKFFDKTKIFLLLIKNFIFILKNIFIQEKISPKKYLFYKFGLEQLGIESDDRTISSILNIKVLEKNDCIFYIDGKISEQNMEKIRNDNISYVNFDSIFKIIPKRVQFKYQMLLIYKLIFNFNYNKNILYSYFSDQLIRDIFLISFCEKSGIKVFINSQYSGLVETPIIPFLNVKNIKTIFWYYSNLGYKYFDNTLQNNYNFELVEDCISLSKYRYVWSSEDCDILQKRNINNLFGANVIIKIIGPVMLGDNKFNLLSPSEARTKFNFNGNKNCKIWITIFDVPVFKPYLHTEHRWPISYYNSEDNFFKVISNLMKKFPNVGFIYKPKRPYELSAKFGWIATKHQEDFVNPNNSFIKNRQLVVLNYKINPYIPIMICDHSIGMSFTSGITAANFFGRESIFFDQIKKTNSSIYPKSLEQLIINSEQDLCTIVEQWLTSIFKHSHFDPITNFNLAIRKLS